MFMSLLCIFLLNKTIRNENDIITRPSPFMAIKISITTKLHMIKSKFGHKMWSQIPSSIGILFFTVDELLFV